MEDLTAKRVLAISGSCSCTATDLLQQDRGRSRLHVGLLVLVMTPGMSSPTMAGGYMTTHCRSP